MSYEATAVVACLATLLIGLALTHPEELRPFRHLKIVLSIIPVLLITSLFYHMDRQSGYFALWSVGFLAIVWKTPLAHYAALGVERLITGDMNRPTGFDADVPGARALYLDGDLEDAIRYLNAELKKEPFHFEGLLLLSEMLEKSHGAKEGIGPLQKLLSGAVLSAEQKAIASDRLRVLEERAIVAELNSRK